MPTFDDSRVLDHFNLLVYTYNIKAGTTALYVTCADT